MFFPGDEVKFLNEEGHGVVIAIQSNSIALVKNDLGFTLDYLFSQLVLVKSKNIGNAKPVIETKKIHSVKAEAPISIKQEDSIKPPPISTLTSLTHLKCGFSQNLNKGEQISWDLYLFNSEDWPYYFTLRGQIQNHWFYLLHGSIESRSNQIVSTFLAEDLTDLKALALQAIPFQLKVNSVVEPVNDIFKVKAPKLFNSGLFINYKNFSKPVHLLVPEKKISSHPFVQVAPNRIEKKAIHYPSLALNQEKEIDLHIEKLEPKHAHLSSHEKLVIQLNKVSVSMDQALVNHCKKLTFIHGVGNGRLKEETRKILASYSSVTIVDGDFGKYGFGATTVFFD